ncbi:MAG: hypothetical protein V3R85_04475 [Alphaproteobacteria bacterium]
MISIDFTPLFPWVWISVLAAVAGLAVGWGLVRRARGTGWRLMAVCGLLAALMNPVAVEEDREARADVLAVLVDRSPSQALAGRAETTEKALAHIRGAAERLPNLELRVIEAGGADGGTAGPVDGTRLFKALGQAIADVPEDRMAGTIIITDGQVHDVPTDAKGRAGSGPVHVLLTGEPGEFDRRLVIRHVPKYGIVGKQVELRIRIEDQRNQGGRVAVTLIQDGGAARVIDVAVGVDHALKMTVDHAGPNILQMEAAAAGGELSTINNRAVIAVNGVRERLRVLLVSGEPHPGERTWRNLLKADPSVDLVHFTILRPPEKQDMTPVRELSLIAFPIRELFEVKLNDFDLIIFDRYRRRGVLPSIYIDNIARYVEGGGAILEAAGPEFAGNESLFQTPLGRVLPGEPTGKVHTVPLRPRLTDVGVRHTVTGDLPGAGIGEELPRWGRWYRQVEVDARRGRVLMSGVGGRPILIVDRVGKGRVAQLLSDQIWLWTRSHGGGGPHAELLRRIAHWLMKEPELEEDSLRAEMAGNRLSIIRRSVDPDASPVEITSPSGKVRTVRLKPGMGGRASALVSVGETGIWRIKDERHLALAAVGDLNPLEFADLRTSAAPLTPLVRQTGGGVAWMRDTAPDLRRTRKGRLAAGSGWFGVVNNQNYTVRSVREVALLPGFLVLLLGLGALMAAWRAEGR